MERELFSAELKRRMKSLEIWIFYLSKSTDINSYRRFKISLSKVRISMYILGPALLQTPIVILGKIHVVMERFHGVILGALNFRWLH